MLKQVVGDQGGVFESSVQVWVCRLGFGVVKSWFPFFDEAPRQGESTRGDVVL
jgi:hypothetical protein